MQINPAEQAVSMKADTPESRFDRAIFFGITALLVFAPLAFGSVHTWAYCIVIIWIFSMCLFHFSDRLFFTPSTGPDWIKHPVTPFLFLFLLLIAFQTIPLPGIIAKLISPHVFADKTDMAAFIAAASGQTETAPGWIRPVYYLHPALIGGIKLASYVLMFFLVLNTATSKKRITLLISVLIFTGFFEAIYGLFQAFTENPRIWWWKSRVGRFHWANGTFIGANHFCFYMEMIFALGFGFLIAQQHKKRFYTSGLTNIRSLFQRMVIWFSPESARPRMFFFFFICLASGFALLKSTSRGGILSMGAAMFVMSVLFLFKPRYRRFSLFSIVTCLIVLVYGVQTGIDPTIKKFQRTYELDLRVKSTQFLLPIIRDYPIAGVGWGNLRHMHTRYIYDDFDPLEAAGYAHNDWLEAGTETGMVGLGCMATAYIVYFIKLYQIWRIRKDRFAVGIGAGVMMAMISVGLHSWVDFSMHIPANPITLAAIMGLGYATIHLHSRGQKEAFFYETRTISLKGSVFKWILIITVICFNTFEILKFSRPAHPMKGNIKQHRCVAWRISQGRIVTAFRQGEPFPCIICFVIPH